MMPNPRARLSLVLLTVGLAGGAALWLLRSSDTPQPAAPQPLPRSIAGSPSTALGQSPTLVPIQSRDEAPSAHPPLEDPTLAALRAKLEDPNTVPGEALLTFRNRDALQRFVKRANGLGLELLGTVDPLNVARIRYGALDQLQAALAANPDAATVEGNLWLSVPPLPPQADPNNQGGSTAFGQTMLSSINANGDRSHWGDRVTVAVLDTGVLSHPTFGSTQITHLDLVNDGQPFHSHGTSVASLIAGQNPQAPGLSPGAQILDVRVSNSEGYTVSSLLAQGIITATDRGAGVINISLGGYGDSPLLAQAVTYAYQHGSIIVAAAGNDSSTQLTLPAAYQSVLSVGSVDANRQQAYFSNSGRNLDLVAPGVGLITAWQTDQLARISGTSQSSALVAGAVAAYLSWGISPSNVPSRIKADARPTGAPSSQTGAGMLFLIPPKNF